MLTDLSKMKIFKVPGYDVGFALKSKDGKFNEVVAVHNNSNIGHIGGALMKSAIKHGAKYLDHFDGMLSGFYEKLGFKEYNREDFDPKYDIDGKFEAKYGKQDIIYRKL